jgi:hypothetical protein
MIDVGLSLGTAAVKIACKIWLRDHTVAADASAEVADILSSKIADVRTRRRVQRQFDQLEETVADRILAVLGHEFRGLDDGERAATVLAARATLDRAALTDEDLFESDLDPIYLERHVRVGSRGLTRDLSDAGVALYDRLLTECCTDIVELTTALPEFGPAAFTEILRRETKLIDMIRDLLDRVPAREATGRHWSADAEFAAAYRAHVANRLDRLRLFGVTQATQRYPLSVAYVSLNVRAGNNLSAAGLAGTASFDSGRSDASREEIDGIVRIEGALSRSSRLLVRGEAGSGKTTLLQWLAVRSARYDFGDQLTRWNALVPFFIQLRHYVDRELPEPRDFVKQIGRHLADKAPNSWVTDLMADGLALVLIDGVDELPGRQRIAARRWLRELLEDFPQAKYVVTSRPAAIGRDWLDSDGFLAADIEPMSSSDVSVFISRWHEAACDDVADDSVRANMEISARKLQEALAARRNLRQLATNPLMCALLCALHYDRGAQLPRDRIEVYDAALEMLLERRDSERGVAIEIPALSRRRKMIILQALAYWLVRNGWSDSTRDRATEQVGNCLASMSDINAAVSDVFQVLLERSGILREPMPGQVDFVHRTFQEYLAARAIIDTGDLGVLLEHAHDDSWHEVVVLAVGYAGAATREDLLKGLLALAETAVEGRRNRLHLVALSCLETAPQVSMQPRAEIERQAARLLPPTTMGQAEAVARSGEFGIELLRNKPVKTARQAAATIRAASLIGGDQALSIISECARHRSNSVTAELFRAWGRFDSEEFAREVLAHTRFDLPAINDPARIPALRYLDPSSLSLFFDLGYGDISGIAGLANLTYLSVRDPLLRDLRPLQQCPNLESLELWETGTIDLTELVGCAKLTKLDFDYSSLIDPFALRSLVQLDNIQASGVNSFAPLRDAIPDNSALRRFGLWEASDMETLSELCADPRLGGLGFLLLGRCHKLQSISGIETWASTMTGIYLHASRLQDYEIIGQLTRLDFANISAVPITDLSFIRNLRELAILHLGGTSPLPPLDALAELTNLNYLFLHGKDDVDLTPLAGKNDLRVRVANSHLRRIHGTGSLGPGVTVIRDR